MSHGEWSMCSMVHLRFKAILFDVTHRGFCRVLYDSPVNSKFHTISKSLPSYFVASHKLLKEI